MLQQEYVNTRSMQVILLQNDIKHLLNKQAAKPCVKTNLRYDSQGRAVIAKVQRATPRNLHYERRVRRRIQADNMDQLARIIESRAQVPLVEDLERAFQQHGRRKRIATAYAQGRHKNQWRADQPRARPGAAAPPDAELLGLAAAPRGQQPAGVAVPALAAAERQHCPHALPARLQQGPGLPHAQPPPFLVGPRLPLYPMTSIIIPLTHAPAI
jgi:hypothetical protein